MIERESITCDIDGVLNFYPQTLINYAKNEHNVSISDLSQFKSQYLKQYTEIKSAYRYSAAKHQAEPRKAVVDTLNSLVSEGFDIVVFTSRPFDRFPGMFEMTLQWLQYIGLNFSTLESKSKLNFDAIKPLFHLDDRLDHILNLHSPKARFFLLQDPAVNEEALPYSNIVRVTERTLSSEIERLMHD